MNPQTYATLYGPWQPTPRRRRGQTAVAVLGAVLWAVTLTSLAGLTFLVGLSALLGSAAGVPVGGFLLRFALAVAGAAAALAALGFAPGVRRLEWPNRMLLLGSLACPVPAVLAISTWIQAG
ncbi:hypothetical protein U9R90_30255 [Streptomyces sp. E11-3]|uniref:hypothetical protein n=1 Tax=Streptomyces sp. E11-3 TaxID=3110112 RepID=UPI0039807673